MLDWCAAVSSDAEQCNKVIVVCLLVQLQFLHVGNDSLVLRQPATVHVCTPL